MEAEITSAGPWEDFKQAGADSPPWADFKPSTPSPEEERRAAKGRALRGEQMAERRSGYGADALMAGADALGYVGDALSKADPLTIVPRLAWSLNQMGKPPEQQQAFPLDDHTPVVPIPRITSEQAADWLRTSGVSPERMAGIANAGIDFAEFFTTPTGINTLISGKFGPEVAKRALAMGFTAQMANDAPEAATRAGELLGNGNVAEGTRAALGAAANVVLPASIIGAHAKFPRVPTPGETAGKMLADTVDNPAVARQLEEIAQQQALEATLPRTLDSRLSTLDRPAGMVTTEGRPWEDFKGAELSKVELPPEQLKTEAETLNKAERATRNAELPEVPAYPAELEGQPYESETFQEKTTRLLRAKAAKVAEVLASAGDSGAVELVSTTRPGTKLLVTPDPAELGKWRVTRVDENGPAGHNLFDGRDAAIRAAAGESFSPAVKGPQYYSAGEFKVARVRPLPETPKAGQIESFPEPLEGQPYDLSPPPLAKADLGAKAVESHELRVESPPAEAKPTETNTQLVDEPVRQVPAGEIATRPDLMQFKRMDEAASGVNEADKLAGQWDDRKAGVLLLWEPLDAKAHGLADGQRYIVANGHHRFEFGERAGRKGYNAQVLREADGFSASDARRIAAEVNIADGKGTVYDQAKYFRNTAAALGPDAALAAGRRIGARGRQAADIGIHATDDLFASFVNEQITTEAARAIATAAPGDAGAQRIGIKFALQGKGADFISNVIKASQAEAGQRAESLDLFGADDSAMKAMAEQAQRASEFQKELRDRITVLRAGKKVEIAKSEGIDVQNPEAIPQRIAALQGELARWENWPMQPDLVAKVKGEKVDTIKRLYHGSPADWSEPQLGRPGIFWLSPSRDIAMGSYARGGKVRAFDVKLGKVADLTEPKLYETVRAIYNNDPEIRDDPDRAQSETDPTHASVLNSSDVLDYLKERGFESARVYEDANSKEISFAVFNTKQLLPATESAATTAPKTGLPSREEIGNRPGKLTSTDFSLAPAETVEQQKVRLAQEQAAREAKAQQDKLAELQAKPLQGTAGDLGQGDLLAQPDDLFAPPTPKAGNPDINSGALGQFGMGGAKPSEYALGQHTATGIKNATVDAERVRRGLPPAMEAGHRAWEGVWDEAMAKLDADPEVQDRLIASLKANPRAVTDLEDALLLHRQVDLQNEYAKATRELAQAYDDSKTFPNRAEAVAELKVRTAELSDRLLELYDVNKAVGTETGRGLAARKIMAYEDFSLAKMEMEKRAAKGGAPLTDAERAEMVKLQQRIEQTQAAYDDYRAKVDQERANRMTDEAIADMKRELASRPNYDSRIVKIAEEIVTKLEKQAAKSDAAIREMLSRASSGLDPTLIYHLGVKGAAMIARKGLDFAKFSLEMADAYGEKVKPYLQAAWERANLHLENEGAKYGDKAEPVKRLLRKRDASGQREGIIEGLQKAKAEGVPLNLAGDYIRKLALSFVRGGITEREALVDAVHKVVTEDVGMDLTRRETMDAISGYGSFKPLDREAAKVLLRDLKGQMQQVAKLEDITAKKPLQKSGVERREQSDEERRLIQQVNEAKRRFGVVVTDPARQLKSALDAVKTRLKNQISDLEYQISTKERIVKSKTDAPFDAETKLMEVRRDELRRQLDELVPKPGRTDEQLLAASMRAVERTIADYEQRIAAGDVAVKKAKPTITSAELEALKARRDAVRAEWQELRALDGEFQRQQAEKVLERQRVALEESIAAKEKQLASGPVPPTGREVNRPADPALEGLLQKRDALNRQLAEARRGPKRSPEEIALAALKTRLTKLAADYADRVASKDYAPRVRKPVILDAEASRLKAIAERVKGEWRKAVALDRLANRSTAEKVMDATVKWHRAAILSSPAVLTKLTAAAAYRTLLGPVEEATKLAWAKVLPGLANAAPRQSGLLLRAEVKALTEGMTAGMRDAWQMLKTGETDLDVLYGKGKDPAGIGEKFVLPPTWLDFFGHLHGALKAPVKRAEWARSMEKRMAWNAAQGVDVTDPGVQMRLGVEAYKDAQRAIFLQDNRVVDVYKAALRRMEDKDKATGETPLRWKAAATTSRLALPIVKVPSNIVAETLETATGLLTGSAKAARAYRKGVESLKPEEADAIMRQLGKGSLGGALLLLGFYTSGNWGGFYVHGEKREPKDIKAGAARVDGMDVPKHLLHYPLMDVIQLGATVARVAGAKAHKRDAEPQGLPAGAVAGLMGLGDEVPFIREGVGLDKLRDPLQRDRYLAEKLKSLVIPQAVQWTARELDKNAAGETVRRDPKTTLQVLQTGLPYYRNSVPEKVEKRTR